jgi:hypothetical protein
VSRYFSETFDFCCKVYYNIGVVNIKIKVVALWNLLVKQEMALKYGR